MATNVKFLRGQSSALSTLTAPSDGVFYLTTDTKKLHVGLLNEDGTTTSVYELNKDISVYSSLEALRSEYQNAGKTPKKGSFFYLEGENIFCVYTGTGYLQINPDTGMTGIEDTRSTVKDEDGYDFASQPITSVTYDSTKRKLIVNSSDKFVTVATYKQLVKVVEDNKIIGAVSSEFTITNDDEKVLQINSIEQSKISGLSDTFATKVDKKTSTVTETNDDGETITKEVDWVLLSPENQSKLAALVIGDGGGIEISGKVNAENVNGLNDFITGNRDTLAGLMSTANQTKLAGIEAGAQVNVIEKIKLAGIEAVITDKTVNVPLAGLSSAGLVKSSTAQNQIRVLTSSGSEGLMEVNSLNVNKLVQTEGEYLELDCGSIDIE